MVNTNDISPIKITENIKSWILSAYLIIEGFTLYLMYSEFMDTQILLQLKKGKQEKRQKGVINHEESAADHTGERSAV